MEYIHAGISQLFVFARLAPRCAVLGGPTCSGIPCGRGRQAAPVGIVRRRKAWQRVDLPQFVLLPLAAARARLQRDRRAFLGAAASGAGMSGSRSESEAGGPWIAVGRGRRLRPAERWHWIVERLFRIILVSSIFRS